MKTNFNYISINEEEFKKQKVKTNYCFIAVILFISIVLLWINYFYSDIDDIDFSEGVGFIVPAPTEIVEADYETINATIYGYSSEKSQTDNSPCITASGYNLCSDTNRNRNPNMVANNCLKFGSRVYISDKLYIVQDRMNKRYTKCGEYDIWYFDIWFSDKQSAINWGVKTKQVIIYK